MQNHNPYAPPAIEPARAVTGSAPPMEFVPPGVWRCDRYIVMHKGGKLPDPCVITGEATADRMPILMTKETGGNKFAFLLGQYGGVAHEMGVKREQVLVQVPIGQRIITFRWLAMAGGGFLMIVGGILLFIAYGLFKIQQWVPAGVAGILGLIPSALGGWLVMPQAIGLDMIHYDGHFLWLQGAHDAYLATLQPWPYQRPRELA